MNWIDTPKSSTISRYRYDAQKRILTVGFKFGAARDYDYFDVPPIVFAQMQKAQSVGQFHADVVKGVFRYAVSGTAVSAPQTTTTAPPSTTTTLDEAR